MSDFWIDLLAGESPITAWDKLVLGGITFPGIAMVAPEISADTDVAKWLKKLATKTTPAEFLITLTDKGYVPGRVRAIIQVWTLDQWEDLKETLPKFTPRSGLKPRATPPPQKDPDGVDRNPAAAISKGAGRDAFDIVHPATALLGIDSVIITNVGMPQLVDQTLYIEIGMMQYFPSTGQRILHSTGGSLNGRGLEPVPPAGAANIK